MGIQLWTLAGTRPASISSISLESATAWLKEGGEKPANNHRSPVDASRVAFALLSVDENDYNALGLNGLPNVHELIRSMGLDPAEVMVKADTVDFNHHSALLPYDSPPIQPFLRTYSISDNVFGIFWTNDPDRRSTKGFMWYRNEEEHGQVSYILNQMTSFRHVQSHPLLPALFTLQAETVEMRLWISSQAKRFRRCN